MPETSAIPFEEASNAFFVTATAMVVTGPTPDLSVQVVFCQDVVKHRLMNLLGEAGEVVATGATFEGYPCRVALGTISLPLDRAKELVSLLQAHIARTEEIARKIPGDSK